MEAYNLTIEQIGNVLRAENINMPAGFIEMGKNDYPIRIQGEFTESDVIKNIVVGNYAGNNILLSDVAVVNDTIREIQAYHQGQRREGNGPLHSENVRSKHCSGLP